MPMPFVEPQFFNTNGIMCSGCKLQSWAAGTSTPQATFTDSTGGTPNANPVILDSAGRANIYLSNLSYKLQLQTSAGVPIWTVDNITAANLNSVASTTSANCTSPGPASAGFVRMCNGDIINWRNIANGANIGLSQGGAAGTGTGNLADVLRYGGAATGGMQANRFMDFSAAPAQSGAFGCGNNVPCVTARNAAGNGDITALQVNALNQTLVGGAAGIIINGGAALTTSNQTGSGSIAMSDSPTFTTTVASVNFKTSAANPAGAGIFRCANNQACLYARNAANNADVEVASLDSSNQVSLAGASGGNSGNVVNVPKIRVNGGVVNSGAGVMHVRVASCTTPASANSGCNTTISWPGTWADTNYTAQCTLSDASPVSSVMVFGTGTKTTTTMIVGILNIPGSTFAGSGTINCIGVHD
jgi:hypothetical protein